MPVIGATTTLGIADGAFHGAGPCNSYGGRVSVNRGVWRIWHTWSTELGCWGRPGVSERAYSRALRAVTSARRDGARSLVLTGDAATLRFVSLDDDDVTSWWYSVGGWKRSKPCEDGPGADPPLTKC